MAESYILFESIGGAEKDLIATAVVANLAKEYPLKKIVVVSLFPEIWLHNPNVYRIYKFGSTPYFYDDYIEQKNSLIFRHDVFNDVSFTKQFSAIKKDHLIKIWSEMVGAKYKQKTPELFFTQRELEVAIRLTFRNKPLFFIDTGLAGPHPIQGWARNIPIEISMEISKRMQEKGFHVFQFGDEKIPNIPGAERLNLSLRLSLATIAHSNARLFSHSVLMHGATALKMPSAIQWIANQQEIYGYNTNENIKLKVEDETKKIFDSFCEYYEHSTPPNEIPLLTREMFDIEKIMNAILTTSLKK